MQVASVVTINSLMSAFDVLWFKAENLQSRNQKVVSKTCAVANCSWLYLKGEATAKGEIHCVLMR